MFLTDWVPRFELVYSYRTPILEDVFAPSLILKDVYPAKMLSSRSYFEVKAVSVIHLFCTSLATCTSFTKFERVPFTPTSISMFFANFEVKSAVATRKLMGVSLLLFVLSL